MNGHSRLLLETLLWLAVMFVVVACVTSPLPVGVLLGAMWTIVAVNALLRYRQKSRLRETTRR